MQTNRFPLTLAIIVIILSWTWTLINLQQAPTIPAAFSDFVWMIVWRKLFVIAVVVALLKIQQQGFDSVGFNGKAWTRQLLTGLLYGSVMFVLINVLLNSVLNSIFPPHAGGGVMHHFKDPANLVVWLVVGIVAGGFVEEVERIFVLTRFEQWLGRPGLVLALILTSVFFGIGHLYQGFGSAITTGIGGLCFGLIYLRRRSALEAITAHAWSDVLAIGAAAWLAR